MGGTRLSIDSKFQLKKCGQRCNVDDDDDNRISQLPDEILIAILSLLPLKEAAKTSVLSPRWINLWKHTTSLDFDADSALDRIARQSELCDVERGKYVDWVNCVLLTHEAPTLTEFKICFDLKESAAKEITQWLEFAFAKKVQRLELDLAGCSGYPNCSLTNYAFPEELLLSGGPSTLQRHMISDFTPLKALSLNCVNITGEAIEFFLCNCPFLEELAVLGSYKLSNLEVCGSSLMLKHLEICDSYNLESIKISAPNLTSLGFTMPQWQLEALVLENVPMLVEASVFCWSFENLLPTFSCCISQLQVLNLTLTSPKEIIEPPKLPNLRKLVIEYCTRGDESLIGLTALIRASPHLEEFVLNLLPWEPSRSDREVKTIKFLHQHLKVIEFCGYCGRTSDVELVKCILDNCVVLERIIIDPCYRPIRHASITDEELDEEQTARKCAKQQLEGEVPQHIELVIR